MIESLTDHKIRRIKPPATGRLQIGHASLSGLVLRVTSSGVRSWSFVYRSPTDGRQVRRTLGPWPTLKVDDACRMAHALKVAVLEGRDPVAEERASEQKARAEQQARQTFRDVAERFMDLVAKPTIESWKNIRFCLDTHLLPRWGDRPIGEISRGDVHAMLDDLVAQKKVGAAREARKHSSRIFSWAYDRELIAANPAYRLRRDEMRKRRPVRRLTDAELRAVWLGAEALGYPWTQTFRLLILTGARRNEIARARWSEVDRERRALEITPARHKSRRGHVIPLSSLAWEVLTSCPRFVGRDPFILSHTHGRVAVCGFAKVRPRLDDAASGILGTKIAPYRTHDLRVAFRTRLARLRVPREVAEACLGHAQPAIERPYDAHDYETEMRDAMECYAEHIRELVAEVPAQSEVAG